MKLLRITTIVLIILIAGTMTTTIILTRNYASNKGSIEGTGFIIQEIDGAGGISFDIDDYGNIYFAITRAFDKGIVIYNSEGYYSHTLPVKSSGAIGVKINDKNEILVYDFRKDLITQFNKKGIETDKISDVDYEFRSEFPFTVDQNVRERNGILYVNNNGTITKVEAEIETVVFTVPAWQKWNRAFTIVTVLSCIALFARFAIPLWIKTYKKHH